MSHETPSSEFEPSQEDLKTIYDGIEGAVKNPAQPLSVHTRPNPGGSATLTELVLGDVDARLILDDELGRAVEISIKDIVEAAYFNAQEITIYCTKGSDNSNWISTTVYHLAKQPDIDPESTNTTYHIFKTTPELHEDKPIEFVEYDPDKMGPLVFPEKSELEDSLESDLRRINEKDIALLKRLAETLSV